MSETIVKEGQVRLAKRIVLLRGDEQSEVEAVLAEWAKDGTGTKVHAEIQRLAGEHPGRFLAAEWQSPLGWMRYLWSKK